MIDNSFKIVLDPLLYNYNNNNNNGNSNGYQNGEYSGGSGNNWKE